MTKLKANQVASIVNDIKQMRQTQSKSKDFSQEEFESSLTEKYPEFSENYKQIFKQAVDGTLNEAMFSYMLMMLKQVETGSVSEHAASVKVGQVLVDEYVKPLINEDSK